MIIHIYSVMWNEQFIMPYFLRHYARFADIFIINHHCTDRTIKLASGNSRTTVLNYPYNRPFTEKDHSKAFVECYKKHSLDADWVMCVDGDEFIYDRNIIDKLEKLKGIVKPTAYMMISKKPPTTNSQIYDEIKTGVRTRSFDKPVILDPKLNVSFGDGRHTIKAGVEPVKSDIKLLHYKYLGRNYYLERAKIVYPRKPRPKGEIEYRLRKGERWYDDYVNVAKEVI